MLIAKNSPNIVILTPSDIGNPKNPKRLSDFIKPELHKRAKEAELILLISNESLDSGKLEIVFCDHDKLLKNWDIVKYETEKKQSNSTLPKRGPGGKFLPKNTKQ